MDLGEVLNLILIFTLVSLILCSVVITYFFIKTLKAITNLAENLKDTTSNLKGQIGLRLLSSVPPVLMALISKFINRRR